MVKMLLGSMKFPRPDDGGVTVFRRWHHHAHYLRMRQNYRI